MFFRSKVQTTARLLLVSSKCKYAAILEKSVNPHVIVVLYNYETVTFNSLLALICASLDSTQKVSIHIIVHFSLLLIICRLTGCSTSQ